MHIRAFGNSFICLVISCGGRTSAEFVGEEPPFLADGGSVFGGTQDDAAQPPAVLGPILVVPGGNVVEGTWYLDDNSHQLKAEEDCREGAPKTFWVPAFRLMKFEATNVAYAACVDDGACSTPDVGATHDWRDPAVGTLPVIVSYPLARAFCLHYGGDLPTITQWDRAASGDPWGAFGVRSLTESWLWCHYGGTGPTCDELAAATAGNPQVNFSLAAVGSHVWDFAPYGHADLFGNAEEWVRSSTLLPGDAAFCALPEPSADPLSFAPALAGLAYAMQFGRLLGPPATQTSDLGVDSKRRRWFPYQLRAWDAPASYTGFRCAYPAL